MDGILRINRIRPKKNIALSLETGSVKSFLNITQLQTWVIFFSNYPVKNKIKKLHRATHIKSTNLKINNKKQVSAVYLDTFYILF